MLSWRTPVTRMRSLAPRIYILSLVAAWEQTKLGSKDNEKEEKWKGNLPFIFFLILLPASYIFSLLFLISEKVVLERFEIYSFHYEKNATLFQTRCLWSQSFANEEYGLYRYTFLCKEIAFLQAKKKNSCKELGGESAHGKKFFFLLLSNSTKNLHHKRTYGILFLKHFLFSFLSPP